MEKDYASYLDLGQNPVPVVNTKLAGSHDRCNALEISWNHALT